MSEDEDLSGRNGQASRLKFDPQRALAFIRVHGKAEELDRLEAMQGRRVVSRPAVASFLLQQNPDGGFPWNLTAGGLTGLDGSMMALWRLEELGFWGQSPFERALAFLAAEQRPDGSWDEREALAGEVLPPWVKPGSLPTQHYLSAYGCFWLALAGKWWKVSATKGAAYLAEAVGIDGILPGFRHGHWIATAALRILGGPFREIAGTMLQAMGGWPLSSWEPSQLAWALNCLQRVDWQDEEALLARWREELAGRQQNDGSWSSEDGPDFAVEATLETLRALAWPSFPSEGSRR